MNTSLYMGWTPKVKTTQEIIGDAIAKFQNDAAVILARQEEYENNGHYAEFPEDRDILESNLKFCKKMIHDLEEHYGEVVKGERLP